MRRITSSQFEIMPYGYQGTSAIQLRGGPLFVPVVLATAVTSDRPSGNVSAIAMTATERRRFRRRSRRFDRS